MQQIVEIAKALVATPRILILDEPTAVLSAARDRAPLRQDPRSSPRAGTTVIYISHRLEEVFEISDRVVVLKDGVAVYSSADTSEIERGRLIRAMVGRSLAAIYPPAARARPAPACSKCRGSAARGKSSTT